MSSRQLETAVLSEESHVCFEAYRRASRYTTAIVRRLQGTAVYRALASQLDPKAVETYYVQTIFEQVNPVVQETLAGRPQLEGRRDRLDQPLDPLLRQVWDDGPYPARRSSWAQRLRATRDVARWGFDRLAGAGASGRNGSAKATSALGPWRIAVEAAEGFDPSRRSDIFWLDASGLTPSQVVVYVRQRRQALAEPLSDTVSLLEQRGIPWYCLERSWAGVRLPWWLANQPLITAARRSLARPLPRSSGSPEDTLALRQALGLVRQVAYWRALFQEGRIKLLFSLTPSHSGTAIAQRIAMDLAGGLTIGAQRSFIATADDDTHGRRPQHLFFVWGDPQHAFSRRAAECPKLVVKSGFVFDGAFGRGLGAAQQASAAIQSAGARTVVALLDNVFGEFYITRDMLVQFYQRFLSWLLRTPEAGLLIKPKKAAQFAQLTEIRPLLEQAQASGRCAVLAQGLGRLSSEVSVCADLTVGLFIGSAVVEAAIRGCRAIHCDLTRLRSHPFYQWGYERVVFDDLGRLLAALERYRRDPASEPELGDHAPVMDELDPFRDGGAGERVGRYLQWLLDALDQGQPRDEALETASERYRTRWGEQTISRCEP